MKIVAGCSNAFELRFELCNCTMAGSGSACNELCLLWTHVTILGPIDVLTIEAIINLAEEMGQEKLSGGPDPSWTKFRTPGTHHKANFGPRGPKNCVVIDTIGLK